VTHTQTDPGASREETPGLTPRSSAVLNDEVLQVPVRNPFAGYALAVGVILLVAFLLRILRLDAYMLGESEGGWAYDGWSIFHGRPVPGSGGLPDVAPLFQLATAISFALFGVTDATARIASALLGFGIVALVFALRPFVSRSHLVAMALLAAISPILVFASRTVDPAISAAFFAFLTLIALLRAGVAATRMTQAGWSLGVGLGLAGMLGSGVDGVTALLSLAVGVFLASVTDASGKRERPRGPARSGVTAIATSPTNIAILLAGLGLALVIVFSRMLTDFTALTGLVSTFTGWGRFMMSRASSLSTPYYFWALLLYEMLAVVFALIAAVSRRPAAQPGSHRRQALNPMLFAGWFFAALVLHSFASGRETSHAVLITLPLVLLAGIGLGDVLARLDASGFWRGQSWGMTLMLLGFALGLVATFAIVMRAMDREVVPASGLPGWLVFLMLAALALVTFGAIGALPASAAGDQHLRIADPMLIMVAAALALFGVISTAGLAFQRADDGTELLARHLPSRNAAALIERVHQVSRDLSVENRSNIDPTGSHGLHIGISPDVRWPLAWYFRDYPFVRVTPPAGWNEDTDVAFATSADGMTTFGLTPQQNEWIIRPPQSHTDLDAGNILGRVFETDSWSAAIRYLVGREIENPQEPSHVTVGYSNRVNNQLNPNFGPFDLFAPDYPGPGSGQGQLNQPAGIGVSPDGEIIYVLNAGNQRIDRYQRDGTFIGVWDGAVDTALGLSWNVNQGGTGLTVSTDGLIYIADTWNHTVVVVDQQGTVVRQLGQRGELTDITDEGISLDSPGLFFGPRGIAVTNERIFVTDTGNERVQVFSRDGTFLTAFGGFGSEPGQLIEPTGILIGPDGNVWVADSGNARIQVFTIEGQQLEEIPVPAWEGQLGVDRLNDLAFDDDGILFLTTPMLGTISAYDGEQIVDIPNAPQVRAGGIAVEPDGSLLITDVPAGVVHRIVPELPEGFGGAEEQPASPVASPGASPVASPVATPAG
jgi:DNA-binding beta-propeller fold protein YncE/4-amino-4-deoxy-L-arabinose transferase-like glycosyltransferase